MFDAQHELWSFDRQAADLSRVADGYMTQAAQLDEDATIVEWERPAWTKVNEERQAETAAGARLTDIDDRLDRSFLRGGPRGLERAQLQVEADELRSAYPDAAAGADRGPVWERRAETAWADDTATIQQLRAQATTSRDDAQMVEATMQTSAAQRDTTQNRLDQLLEERRNRDGEPPRHRQVQHAHQSPFGPWPSLSSDRSDATSHSPGIDEPGPNINPQRGQPPQL